jgi:sterol 14-demethylase
MKITIDYDLCQGHGTCKGEAPEVFDVDAEACRVIVLREAPPPDLHEKVRLAAKYCPTQAIRLDD